MSLIVPREMERARVAGLPFGIAGDPGDNGGVFVLGMPHSPWQIHVIVSDGTDGSGWEHVSVKLSHENGNTATPTWKTMALIKAKFWNPEDTVIQFHPPASQYVNTHPHVLHLWRSLSQVVELPPRELIG